MKKLIVPETVVDIMSTYLTQNDRWDEYEMIIVRDEDYDTVMRITQEHIEDDFRMRTYEIGVNAD